MARDWEDKDLVISDAERSRTRLGIGVYLVGSVVGFVLFVYSVLTYWLA